MHAPFRVIYQLVAVMSLASAMVARPALAQDLVVKIGHVGPTSGSIAHLGKDNENGARLAIDELNAKGVTIGGKRVRFELLAEDDAADPKQSSAAAQKLIDSKVNGVVGHLNSGTSISASKIYSEAGIPQISPSATNPKYTRTGYKTTFRLIADDANLATALGRYTASQLGGRNIAVIDDRTAYGQGLADEFVKGVRSAGGQIVGREFTSDKSTDFTSQLLALKARRPDFIFFGGMDAIAGPMLRQMKQLGINAKLLGGDGMCSDELPKLAVGAMGDGQVLCAEGGGIAGGKAAATKAIDDFRAKYKSKFNADVQMYAPYTYDAVNVMVAAMVKAGSADPARYLQVLAKTSGYKGVTGIISFDCKGDLTSGAISLFSYDRGTRRPIGQVLTGPVPDCAGARRPQVPMERQPQSPPAIAQGKGGLTDHRAQGDAGGAPAVVAAIAGVGLATATRYTFEQGIDALANASAWKPGKDARDCLEALKRLKAVGSHGDYDKPSTDNAISAELSFAKNCLGKPDARIAPRVGRLQTPDGVRCTVTLIGTDLALTARHCAFSNPSFEVGSSSAATIRTDIDTLRSWQIEFGEIGAGKKFNIQAVILMGSTGWTQVEVQSTNQPGASGEPSISLKDLDNVQSDFAVFKLSGSMIGAVDRPRLATDITKGDRLFMVGFYPGFELSPGARDDGLRQQVAGLCQVIEVNDRCFVHGCTTNGRASGSAMFVERFNAAGAMELRLVGIHATGAIPDSYTQCPAGAAFSSVFNIGVRIRADELATMR